MSPSTSSQSALAELLGPNDPEPTDEERREHQAMLASLRDARYRAVRQAAFQQTRDLLKEHDRRASGEPYLEDPQALDI